VLEEIEGVGKKKRMALLTQFGTIDKIISASEDDLSKVEGVGPELAHKIYLYFKEEL
jgi:excinuclease ABC subunit C